MKLILAFIGGIIACLLSDFGVIASCIFIFFWYILVVDRPKKK